MKKFTKLALAAMLVLTSAAAVGCSKSDDTSKSATNTTTSDSNVDAAKTNRAVFAAVLIADEKMTSQFSKAVKGIDDAGKDVTFSAPSRSKDDAIAFLAPYWDKDAAGKEYDALLGDAAYLANANKQIEAKVNKDNAAAKKEEDKKQFKPLTAVADSTKLSANNLSGAKAQFQDAKVENKDGKYTVEYKGLKYTMEKSGNTYKVVSKEGTLTK
ncbi:hypothetical protein [Tumebacillus flagellatus]|uniref:Lipoprotein n=1 Tax=Tumebacillus flagellatus TaxID=1157490 RepID=A0A074LNE0_9BACL|nr:hypothetical protein [Tumebacillus flagellatus]KEO83636.1 hypothetical protein EL26_09505 [Tumebacillus flagellatus]